MAVRVTLDTNTLPVEDWLGSIDRTLFEFAVVSVTSEETSGTTFSVHLTPLGEVQKHTAYGAGAYGVGPYGGTIDKHCLRRALEIITNGAFTDPDLVDGLSSGQRRQRRDAEIICVHIREGRDVFVTLDEKGFIRSGRRESLEAEYGIRIMTPPEFVAEFGA